MLAGSHGLYEIGDTLFSTVEPGATVFDVGVMVASQLVHPECQLFADLSSAAVEQPIREGAQDPLLDDASANVRADRAAPTPATGADVVAMATRSVHADVQCRQRRILRNAITFRGKRRQHAGLFSARAMLIRAACGSACPLSSSS